MVFLSVLLGGKLIHSNRIFMGEKDPVLFLQIDAVDDIFRSVEVHLLDQESLTVVHQDIVH